MFATERLRLTRRQWLAALAGCTTLGGPTVANASKDDFWALARQGGNLFLMRHASTEPGIGDPPGFQIGNCNTQRNLSAEGRQEARLLGARMVGEGVRLDAVYSSAWCRCTETAALAFDPHYAKHSVWPALNSFFQGQGDAQQQTQAVLKRAGTLAAPQNWMLVTHQVNITTLTGSYPAMGEVFLTRPSLESPQGLKVLARWRTQTT